MAIKQTLGLMKKMAWEAKRLPTIKKKAVHILNQRGLINGRDRFKSAIGLSKWVSDKIQFWPDPEGTETVQSAERTLQLGYGDCDCMAILLAALLMSVGIRVRFRVVGVGRPQHVFVEAFTEKGWIGLDPAAGPKDPDPYKLKTFFMEEY